MKKRRFPIHAKVAILIFLAASVLVEVAMVYFSLVSSKKNQQHYKDTANNLSATIAQVVDVQAFSDLATEVREVVDASETHPMSDEWGTPEWKAYQAQFATIEASQAFQDMRAFLQKIQSANAQYIDCAYLTYVDPVNEWFVYVVDGAEEEPCPPGCLDPIYDMNRDTIKTPSRGFPAYITNTAEYGWLVTAGTPVYSGEDVIGYAMVDIPMAEVRKAQADSIIRLFIYLTVTALALGAVAMLVVDLSLIRPLRILTKAASGYDAQSPAKNKEIFDNLEVKNHDEIGELADSMKRMENDVRAKIEELTATNDELIHSQRVAAEMTELANKDALTGIRNKTAFDHDAAKINEEIAAGGTEPFGIAMVDLNYLKTINDQRGHNKGDIALLKLSNIICGVFAHSRVYRVGGDEFVALLKKSDYARSGIIIGEFNEKIRELHKDMDLPLEERVSAAIGYAEYRPGEDKTVEEVLARADEAMYGKKREMKEEDGENDGSH